MLKLRLLTGPRAGRQLRVSDTKPVSIGRRKGRLRLHDSRVSKNHAEIYFANDMWVLRDLGSANGTYVNRKRVSGLVELEPGDLIQMGRVLFKIVRCDGIGMDTQPALPDELLGDEELSFDKVSAPANAGDDDLDLEALFGGSESADSKDANDDSDIFAAVDEPATTQTPSADLPKQEEPAPEPIEAAFETPVDDDDSFFADLGETTDTSDGVNVAVNDALNEDDALGDEHSDADADADPFNLDDAAVEAQSSEPSDPAEASDPFLSGVEDEEPEDSGDLISLEDESGIGPRSSGTTLLTAVSHEDLVNDESEASGSAVVDAADEPETQAPQAAESEDAFEDEFENEDDDDQAPALVGLHLDQAPPQQPEAIEEELVESEPEAEQVSELNSDASLDGDEDDATDLLIEEPLDEPVAAEVSAEEFADDSPVVADEIEPAEEDQEEPEVEEDAEVDSVEDDALAAFDISDALSDDDVEPAIEEVLGELGSTSDAFDDLTEQLLAEQDEDDSQVDGVSTDDDETAALAADVLDMDEVDAGLVEAEPEDDPLASLAEEIASEDVPTDEPEPEPVAVDAPQEDELPEGAPVFDIDAAFDALSEGLDDSFELPAIGADDEQAQPAESAAADPLAGSQLDVGYIKDALSKLDQEQGGSTDGRGDSSPQASASPTMPPGSLQGGDYIQSPPPGLNPSSLKPPQEPGETYRPPGNTGRWFFTLLLFLAVGGAGVWYITEHYDIQITGRDDGGPASANAAAPGLPDSQNPRTTEVPPAGTTPPGTDTPTPGEPVEPEPQGPNPFASGPVLLGQDALDGITRGSTGSPTEPDPTPNPGVTDTPDPTGVVAIDPPLQPDVEPGPVDVPSVDDEPVVPQPPARIVFLVDASGSLVDSLPQMLVWLNRAIQTIESDERFAIYFFKSGEPISIKPEGMITPTREVLNQINTDWLSADRMPVFPSGRSNPTKAIAKALTLNPTDIYFLSDDAFAFTQGDSTTQEAIDLVKAALGDSDARVHGVQFFYRSADSALETLANDTKGTFEFVRERVVPNADPIDLLEELDAD